MNSTKVIVDNSTLLQYSRFEHCYDHWLLPCVPSPVAASLWIQGGLLIGLLFTGSMSHLGWSYSADNDDNDYDYPSLLFPPLKET